MIEKKRLDNEIFERGLSTSREKAKAFIMAGQVYVNNQKADKAGTTVKSTDIIEVRGPKIAYVSRGGLKLEKAMSAFPITLNGKISMDVGASTGGFTDCMLQNGAVKVYAIDVGYGQLDWKLRSDERVVVMERTNFRYVTKENISEDIDFASVDVSFISLKLIFPALYNLMGNGATAVCLIKPQFEAGKDKIGKKGVVRDINVHKETIQNVIGYATDNGFSILGLTYSPVKGPEGNIEYLLYISKLEEQTSYDINVDDVVDSSHTCLDDGGKNGNLQKNSSNS